MINFSQLVNKSIFFIFTLLNLLWINSFTFFNNFFLLFDLACNLFDIFYRFVKLFAEWLVLLLSFDYSQDIAAIHDIKYNSFFSTFNFLWFCIYQITSQFWFFIYFPTLHNFCFLLFDFLFNIYIFILGTETKPTPVSYELKIKLKWNCETWNVCLCFQSTQKRENYFEIFRVSEFENDFRERTEKK